MQVGGVVRHGAEPDVVGLGDRAADRVLEHLTDMELVVVQTGHAFLPQALLAYDVPSDASSLRSPGWWIWPVGVRGNSPAARKASRQTLAAEGGDRRGVGI